MRFRFDARVFVFFFPSLKFSLSTQILSVVVAFFLSFSLLLLLSPDDDHLSVLRCCVWRNVVVVFSRSRKREKEYTGASSLKRKERDEEEERAKKAISFVQPKKKKERSTHSEIIITSSLSLLIFFLKQRTGCPRRLGGDEIGQSLGLSPVCPDDSNTHRRFISRVSKVGRRHRQSRETTHVRGNRKRAIRVSTVGKWNHVFTVSHE